MRRYLILGAVVTLVSTACFEDNADPTVLRIASESGGPRIVFDLDERPFPEIPFPNDLATRIDPTSPTGRRVNVSLIGATEEESRVRAKINDQSGFGVLSPMWVRFDAPLNARKIAERHQEPVPNFTDDVVYLVNVDRDSPNFGRFELLDLGRGNYPLIAPRPDRYFPNDPRSEGNNLVFETVAEYDLNGNGKLDPIEDTDDDGVWDKPNVFDIDEDPSAPGNLIEFYETETNTLYLRNVDPLDSGTTYAIVITDELTSLDGLPIDSPFTGINHARQTEDLQPLRQLLPQAFPSRFDESLEGVRFAWTFTTGVPEDELLAVRAGLYGHGPLKWLAEQYPAELEMIHNQKDVGAEEPLVFSVEQVVGILVPILSQEVGAAAADQIRAQFDDVDYIVSGSFVSPYFLADDDGDADTGVTLVSTGGNPADDDETFRIDLANGEAVVGEDEVTFMCTVPKEMPGRSAPFPTMIYSHAISSTRLENLLFGSAFAKFGIASCTIDAVGHGIAIPPEFVGLLQQVTTGQGIPNFGAVIDHDRARDLDNDGVRESGGKYFTSDILHSRDNIRQTAIDQIQLVRILRSWGERRWPAEVDESSPYVEARRDLVAGWDANGDGEPELAGDFNGDGVIDFGGDVAYVSFGTSLGGIQTALLAAFEPTIIAAGSNAGGGILGDIASRTTISNVRNGVVLRMFGPLLLGNLNEDGDLRMRWLLASADEDVSVPFGTVSGIEEGDRVVLINKQRLANPIVPEEDRIAEAHIRNGELRIAIASDAVATTARRARLGLDPTISTIDDIMDCRARERCGDTRCEGGAQTCRDDACYPVADCIQDFDPANASGEFADALASHIIEDPEEWGDGYIIEIYGADGELKTTIDSFPQHLVYENILYPRGAPLAALTQGWGLKRQTPELRKFLGIAQTLLEPADPAVAARHYMKQPFSFPYEQDRFQDGFTRFLMIGTIGDQTVPIGNSIAIARAAGYVDSRRYDGRYGMTENQFLTSNFVYEGIAELNRFPEKPNTLFDPDDLDQGRFRSRDNPDDPRPNPDGDPPLLATVQHADGSYSALRLPYLRVTGEHTFNVPNPAAAFDVATYMTNHVGWYLSNSGNQLTDELCLVDSLLAECSFYDYESYEAPIIQR